MKIKRKLSKNIKCIILLCFGILTIMTGFICYMYFGAEHIQRRIKERICTKVMEYEAELLEIAEGCQEEVTLYYQELDDEEIRRVFRYFRLYRITKWSDGSVEFHVRSSKKSILLWNDYRYGFYYCEDDKPRDVVWIHDIDENETEYEDIFWGGTYWYKTEKITDNWWFYETKTVSKYKTHR